MLNSPTNQNHNITVKPKLDNFFIVYLVSQIPSLIIKFLLVLLVIILIIVSVGASFSGEVLNSEVVVNNNAVDKILVYNLDGAISSGSDTTGSGGIFVDDVRKDFELIKKDDTIKNVVFKFNSPGGEVFASEVLGDLINDLLKAKNIKEGVFYFDSISASGALLAAYKVKQNYVFGSTYGQTGSIGVRLEIPNVSKLAENVGYKQIVIKSGNSKDVGSVFREPTNDEFRYFQSQVDKSYNDFLNIIVNSRPITLEKLKPIANGFVYFNTEAKEMGLLDEVSINDQAAVKKAASNVGVSNYNTVSVKNRTSFFSSLGVKLGLGNIFNFAPVNILDNQLKLRNGIIYSIAENYIQ